MKTRFIFAALLVFGLAATTTQAQDRPQEQRERKERHGNHRESKSDSVGRGKHKGEGRGYQKGDEKRGNRYGQRSGEVGNSRPHRQDAISDSVGHRTRPSGDFRKGKGNKGGRGKGTPKSES